MAVLGKIVTVLSANTAQFEKGLNRAKRRMHKFGQDVVRVGGQLAGMGIAAGAAALGGLAMMTRSGLESVDALAKTSDKLGLTTEQLATLQHGARLAGMEEDALGLAIQRMTVGLGEAAAGTGEAKKALEDLGLDATALAAAGPYEAFRKIAEALSNVTNSSVRAAAGAKIFGARGLAIVNMTTQGAAGIDAMAAETERLGLSLSRVDAAKVEAANDAMTRVGEAIMAIGQRLAIELAPFIDAIAAQFTEFATTGEGMAGRVTEAVGWMVSAIEKLANSFNFAKAVFLALRSVVRALFSALLKVLGTIMRAMEWMPKLGGEIKKFRLELDAIANVSWEAAGEDMNSALDAWEDMERNKLGDQFRRWVDKVRADAQGRAEKVAADANRKLEPVAGGMEYWEKRQGQYGLEYISNKSTFGGAPGKRSMEPVYKAKPEMAEPPEFGGGAATAIAINRRAYASV
ncbi:MAG TPA: hypothetical protein VM013_04180, partial [Dehalococcoidia bacterium]|nr:hypothetical protein [Dehalococcoidia bacterium]